MNLKFKGADKVLHFELGGLIALFVAIVVWFINPKIAFNAGLLASAVAGLAKEGFDYMSNRAARAAGKKAVHTVDPLDFVATVLGGALVLVLARMLGWA